MDSEKYLLRRTSSAKSAAQRKTSSLITATTRILFAGCFAVDAIQVLGKCCTVRNCSSRLSNICAAVRVACWWQLRTALAPIPWRAGILVAGAGLRLVSIAVSGRLRTGMAQLVHQPAHSPNGCGLLTVFRTRGHAGARPRR